jgi:hypothetical protein
MFLFFSEPDCTCVQRQPDVKLGVGLERQPEEWNRNFNSQPESHWRDQGN